VCIGRVEGRKEERGKGKRESGRWKMEDGRWKVERTEKG
jgi:hypothetical protein